MWRFRIKEVKGRKYLTAYKCVNGKQVERSLGSLEELERRRKDGIHILHVGSLIIIFVEKEVVGFPQKFPQNGGNSSGETSRGNHWGTGE